MKISIVGWYGTETMGDRAILDGILAVINDIEKTAHIAIGSLYPFYTERTLFEEKKTFADTAPEIVYSIFDSKNRGELSKNIAGSSLLILGGGPLMDLEELYIIRRAFRFAKKNKVPAVVMGCGLGPLNRPEYIKCVKDIFAFSSAVALRDKCSYIMAKELFGEDFGGCCMGDPAVISIEKYKKSTNYTRQDKDFIAVNLRKFPTEYGNVYDINNSDIRLFLEKLSGYYGKIKLIPMHTFSVGGDDRSYFAELFLESKNNNICSVNKPMNLWELYRCYSQALFCVGMRYHSIVMQTILNGNNYIINYTNPKEGKTVGYLKEVDNKGFYTDRIVHIQMPDSKEKLYEMISKIDMHESFEYCFSNMKNNYVKWLRGVLETSGG